MHRTGPTCYQEIRDRKLLLYVTTALCPLISAIGYACIQALRANTEN